MSKKKIILCVAPLILGLSVGLILDGCGQAVNTNIPVPTGTPKDPKDPTTTLNNAEATKAEIAAAIKASKQETAQLQMKYDQLVEDGIVAKLWWAFGVCCLSLVGCGAAAWFLPLFRAKALQGIAFSVAGAGLCLVLMKLVPHMWQIAWGVAGLVILAITFYFLRHAKGVSTAFAWTSEFAQQISSTATAAAEKEKFFVNKLAESKVFDRKGLKALRDKALTSPKKGSAPVTKA
jgi:hypothetical protein